ncbi:Uncharacterised protein [Chlamydia trachomatis]|nr:Uncharacterised protein [Chlamydia trachomatis]
MFTIQIMIPKRKNADGAKTIRPRFSYPSGCAAEVYRISGMTRNPRIVPKPNSSLMILMQTSTHP